MTIEQKKKQLEKRHAEWVGKYIDAGNQYVELKKQLEELHLKKIKYSAKCAELEKKIRNLHLPNELPKEGSWWCFSRDPQNFTVCKIETRTSDYAIMKTYELATIGCFTKQNQIFRIFFDEELKEDAIKYLFDFKEITEEEAKRLIEIGQRCDNTPLGEIKYLKE